MGNPFSVPLPSEQASGQPIQPKPASTPGNPFSVPFASEAAQQPQEPTDYSDPTGGGSATNTPEARAEQSSTLQSAAVGAIKEVGRQGHDLAKFVATKTPLEPITDFFGSHFKEGAALDKKVNDALAAKNDHERIGGYATLGFQFASAFPELAERLLPGMAKRATVAEEGVSAAGAEAPAPAVSSPSLAQKVIKGEKVAQPAAKAALGDAAQAAAADSGVATTGTAGKGIRTFLDESISKVAVKERATYDALNEAAETDLKSLYERRMELQDAVDDPVNIVNEDALRVKLERTDMQIKNGENTVLSKPNSGVDLDTLTKAKAMTQQRYALQEVKAKLFNNENVVAGNVAHGAGETVNVDSAINAAERLNKPSRWAQEGSPTRLQQALGKDGANNLLKALYDAKKQGASAIHAQKVAKIVAKYVVPGTAAAATAAYEISK